MKKENVLSEKNIKSEIENPIITSEDTLLEKTYSVEDAFDNLYDKLQEQYGVDLRKT